VWPAERRVQQRQVAGSDDDLIGSPEHQVLGVTALHLADLAVARKSSTNQILDVDNVQPALGEPSPRTR
jgi:hypothetical protein